MTWSAQLLVVVGWLLSLGCFSAGAADSDYQSIDTTFLIHQADPLIKDRLPAICASEEQGLRLACDPLWKIQTKGRELLIKLSSDPRIELRARQADYHPSKGIQFGWAELRALGRYQGWFDIEQFPDCGRKIVVVKGFPVEDPRARAFDYYLVDWERIYSVQFTVSRAVKFEDFRPLFEEIIDSVEFVVENKDTVSFRAPNQRQCQTITRE